MKNDDLGFTLIFFYGMVNFFTETPIGKTLKIFLSEARRPRPLIFGMQLYLVDLYQDYSNHSPAPRVTCFTLVHIGKILQTTRPIKAKYITWSLNGWGEQKFVCRIWSPRWSPCPYMVKTFEKLSSLEPNGSWSWGFRYAVLGMWVQYSLKKW